MDPIMPDAHIQQEVIIALDNRLADTFALHMEASEMLRDDYEALLTLAFFGMRKTYAEGVLDGLQQAYSTEDVIPAFKVLGDADL